MMARRAPMERVKGEKEKPTNGEFVENFRKQTPRRNCRPGSDREGRGRGPRFRNGRTRSCRRVRAKPRKASQLVTPAEYATRRAADRAIGRRRRHRNRVCSGEARAIDRGALREKRKNRDRAECRRAARKRGPHRACQAERGTDRGADRRT